MKRHILDCGAQETVRNWPEWRQTLLGAALPEHRKLEREEAAKNIEEAYRKAQEDRNYMEDSRALNELYGRDDDGIS